MGNLANDIVEEVNIKPNNTKRIIRIVISVATSLIVVAFAFGQFKSSFFNRMDSLEEKVDKHTIAVEQLATDMGVGFEAVDTKIDKIYGDGLTIFNNFQEYNDAQLGLIIDYGNGNKDMLKRMLEISSMKQTQQVETQIETSKKEEPKPIYESSISVQKVDDQLPADPDKYYGMVHFIEVETNDTIFHITGATKKYYNGIDKNKYEVGAMTDSPKHPTRYDFSYRNKR